MSNAVVTTPEEEQLLRTLAAHSDDVHQKFTIEQVRSIKRLFDRADTEKTGTANSGELRDILLRIGDETAHKILKELVARGVERLTFPEFVRTFQARMSADDACRLMDLEVQYIQSMGIDTKELQQMEDFRATKLERSRRESNSGISQSSSSTTHNNSSSGLQRHSSSVTRRTSSMPNDVDDYKREFGLEEEN